MKIQTVKIQTAIVFALFVAPALANDTLVAPGATWRYLDDGSNQGTAWRAASFDDSSWSQGPSPLGYGEGDEATVVSFGGNSSDKHPTTYFRHTFSVADASDYVAMRLELERDDGAAMYLNGVEVRRDNLGANAGFLTFANDTVAGVLEDQFFETSVDASLLVTGTNVLAVEVHQRSAGSSDLSLDVELVGETGVTIRRGPYVQAGTANSATIRWRTNVPSTSRVQYGFVAGAPNAMAEDMALVTDHELQIAGPSNAQLFYEVGEVGQPSLAGGDANHFARIPPFPGTSTAFRCWALGDSGTANAAVQSVRDAFLSYSAGSTPDLMLMLGDNAYEEGLEIEYQNGVFETFAETMRHSAVFPTRGNHDDDNSVYTSSFTMPTAGEMGGVASGTEAYYSFDWANVHFVCLDSEGTSLGIGGPMWTWLQADLSSTAQTWVVAFWHHPPYTKGSHDSDTEGTLISMRQNFLPLLESHGVDLVLCGHSHSYERSFLIDGHYGGSGSFQESMKVNAGDGSETGDGVYFKETGPNAGAVYCVAGCAGKLTDGPLNHPVMAVGILDVLGSVVLDVDGERMDVRFLNSSGQVADEFTLTTNVFEGNFCVSKPTAIFGCLPKIQATGTPSATDPNPFNLSASVVVEQKNGLLFYGFGSTAIQTIGLGGTLCVQPPLARTMPQNSGGSFICEGTFTYDFNALIQSGILPQLAPGAVVAAQYWFRDPADAFGTGLTDAVQFVIQP